MIDQITSEDRQSLFVRRRGILDATYAGNKPDQEEWEKLAADFRAMGMQCAADSLMERFERMQ